MIFKEKISENGTVSIPERLSDLLSDKKIYSIKSISDCSLQLFNTELLEEYFRIADKYSWRLSHEEYQLVWHNYGNRKELDLVEKSKIVLDKELFDYLNLKNEICFKANNGFWQLFNPSEISNRESNLLELPEKIVTLNEISNDLYKELLNNPDLLKTLNWRVFEKLLADILESFNYEIELMQGTKDGGVDIIAFRNHGVFGGEKYIVQAKRYKDNKVQVEPVRNLLFIHNDQKATKSCLATTSSFTKGAIDLANQYKWQMELKDFNDIKSWIETAYKIKSL